MTDTTTDRDGRTIAALDNRLRTADERINQLHLLATAAEAAVSQARAAGYADAAARLRDGTAYQAWHRQIDAMPGPPMPITPEYAREHLAAFLDAVGPPRLTGRRHPDTRCEVCEQPVTPGAPGVTELAGLYQHTGCAPWAGDGHAIALAERTRIIEALDAIAADPAAWMDARAITSSSPVSTVLHEVVYWLERMPRPDVDPPAVDPADPQHAVAELDRLRAGIADRSIHELPAGTPDTRGTAVVDTVLTVLDQLLGLLDAVIDWRASTTDASARTPRDLFAAASAAATRVDAVAVAVLSAGLVEVDGPAGTAGPDTKASEPRPGYSTDPTIRQQQEWIQGGRFAPGQPGAVPQPSFPAPWAPATPTTPVPPEIAMVQHLATNPARRDALEQAFQDLGAATAKRTATRRRWWWPWR